jgi:peroxiredoxin Q/BCP
MALGIGDKVPNFKLPTDGGGTLSPADLKGTKWVLYFYPKDDTSGCTQEAKDFTARAKDFAAAETRIVGISKDPAKKHDKFKDKYAIPYTLIADEEKELCRAFGVWVEKTLYGRKYMGIERSTFLIDGTGKIRAAWPKVKIAGHADAVLDAARKL